MTEPNGGSNRTWWIVAAALAAGWVLYLTLLGPKVPREGPLPRPALQQPPGAPVADYRWVLRDLQDAPVDFARYEGKAVFLNVWATWCAPCVAELPAIANLADNPRLKDVAFVCASTDESAERVQNFLREKRWSMTVLRATALPEVFLTEGIPATFLIAPDGRIAASEVGAAQWDDPAVVDFLERLARQARPSAPAATP